MKKLIPFLLFLFPYFNFNPIYTYAQESKIIKRLVTDSEFNKLKISVGTYQEGKNYNQIIKGHGTGLMPPTEEQWKDMRNQPLLIDRIEYSYGISEIPASHDNSATIWFPPIGHQGSEGSCVPWACVYYTKTFQEAKEHNWNLSACSWEGNWGGNPSTAYWDKIFSPDFSYHLLNNGDDKGISYANNLNLLEQIGCCTWDKMPNDPVDHITWPSENAWRQAPLYRSQTGYNYMPVDSDPGIEDLKLLLANGNLAVISMDANYFYEDFTSEDLWTLDNYNATGHNHATTIVGYDDNFGPFTESGNSTIYGAFKVANSWGVGNWEYVADGFYYISYECLKQRISNVYVYENHIDYQPKMLAVFEMDHDFRKENKIDFGVLDQGSSQVLKSLNNFSTKGGNYPYPNNPIVIDITDLMPYISDSANQFFMKILDGSSSTTGTIQYFAIEIYDDYANGVLRNVYVSTEVPINTIQYSTIWVNVYTSPETILIISPTGGEIFEIGSNPIISYTSAGTSGYLNLDYTTDEGTRWNSIASNILDNGNYSGWIVPNTPSANCKIRISDIDGSPSVISKGLFRIGPFEFTEQTSISLTGVGFGSVAWGDYDNDSDLDILLIGDTGGGNNVSKIYRNDGSNTFTEQTSISLTNVRMGSAIWGDYDHDGYLDILLTGEISTGNFASKIYRNNRNNAFIEQTSISLTNVLDGSVAWGDYDNDGDLDIILTGLTPSEIPDVGTKVSKIYNNDGNNTFTEQISISLLDITMGSVAWGDYDNDGYLDILITGESDLGRVSKIYHNNGNNTFTDQTSISLIGVGSGSVAWGDYDNDGDLDILLTGAASGPTSKIYCNNGDNTFTEQTSIHLFSVWGGSATWGDYDNDGDLDILLTGNSPNSVHNSKIYRNNGNNTFSEQVSISLDNANSAAWGDYDNDGDLDILLTGGNNGGEITKIYRNNCTTSNTPPSAPPNLLAEVIGNDVTFSWDKSTDNQTPQNGLHYNLVIGTTQNGFDKLSPMADRSTGYRRVVRLGNSQTKTWTIKNLPDGIYYWSVQAIDNSFSGSDFAPEQTFTIGDEFEQFTEQKSTSLTGVEYSSVAWGDYDNDGNLDILSIGLSENLSSKIYRNNGDNTFSDQTLISLAAVWEGSVAWGDYDNDDDLDILLTGSGDNEDYISKIYRNDGNNFFSGTSITLTGVCLSSVAWGDYDNDGDLDILLTGFDVSKIYRNNGDNTFTEQISIDLIAVSHSSVAWGDYDNDGDLDILLTGIVSWNTPVSKLYRNNGDNTFIEQTSIDLIAVFHSSVAWGDYDNDGDLDILLTGNISWDTPPISKIYQNNGDNTFTEQTSIDLTAVSYSSVAWGDYDNDGDLDILLTGQPSEGHPISKIYRNNGDNTFTEQTSIELTGVSHSSAAWGDYDNDGDLDLLLTGNSGNGPVTKIYRNNNLTPNKSPSTPSSLQAAVNGSNIIFSWDKSSDNETPQNGLHYNLVIGTTPNGVDKLSPMSDRSTGYRRVVRLGNSQINSWTIKNIPDGNYYWSVQAIDNCFAGSPFAAEQVVAVPLPVELTSFEAKVQGSGVLLDWETATEINNYGFEIERRINIQTSNPNIKPELPDENHWFKIGFIKGNGNSISQNFYSYTDKNPTGGSKFEYRLKQIDIDGTFEYSDIVEVIILPTEYKLFQNYPNPFNPSTAIRFSVPKDGLVSIKVFDILGNEITALVNEMKQAGTYEVVFNGSKLSSGIYFYEMRADNFSSVKQLMLIK